MSDTPTITIRYTYDRANALRLFENSYRYLFTHSYRRYIGWFFIALLQFGVVAALKQGRFGVMLFSSVTLMYWYVVKKAISKRRALSSYEHSPLKESTITLVADDEGIRISHNKGETFWHWEEIDDIVDAGEDVLIYKNPLFYYIPSTGFPSLEAKNAFKRLAKKHLCAQNIR